MKQDQCEHCEDGLTKEGENCTECCPHYELDHFICLDCGTETDPGILIDRAMDRYDD